MAKFFFWGEEMSTKIHRKNLGGLSVILTDTIMSGKQNSRIFVGSATI